MSVKPGIKFANKEQAADMLARGLWVAVKKGELPQSPIDSTPLLVYVQQYRQSNPFGNCPLPVLYRQVAQPAGLTIGQFHDCLRALVANRKIRLHPFTGAAYQLRDEECAMLLGQEIKMYAEDL